MQKVLARDSTLHNWTPANQNIDDKTLEYIRGLGLPGIGTRPTLLLHNLGNFQQDPEQLDRIAEIFNPEYDTSVSFPLSGILNEV